MTRDLYYEDVVVGAEMETAPHAVTRADILTFAEITRDHHPRTPMMPSAATWGSTASSRTASTACR